jgi:hypothetical protein
MRLYPNAFDSKLLAFNDSRAGPAEWIENPVARSDIESV